MTDRCMCGDSECPTCGSLQGTREEIPTPQIYHDALEEQNTVYLAAIRAYQDHMAHRPIGLANIPFAPESAFICGYISGRADCLRGEL